jgi:hypothetical protein
LGFAAGAFELPAFAVQLKPDRIDQHQAGRAVWATVLNFDLPLSQSALSSVSKGRISWGFAVLMTPQYRA